MYVKIVMDKYIGNYIKKFIFINIQYTTNINNTFKETKGIHFLIGSTVNHKFYLYSTFK